MISIIFVIETISSLSDKVKFFVINFSSNSTWEDNGYPLPEFNPLTKHKICDIFLGSGWLQTYKKSRLYKS